MVSNVVLHSQGIHIYLYYYKADKDSEKTLGAQCENCSRLRRGVGGGSGKASLRKSCLLSED